MTQKPARHARRPAPKLQLAITRLRAGERGATLGATAKLFGVSYSTIHTAAQIAGVPFPIQRKTTRAAVLAIARDRPGLSVRAVGKLCGISGARVHQILRTSHNFRARRSDNAAVRDARIVKATWLRAAGLSYEKIATALDVSSMTARSYCLIGNAQAAAQASIQPPQSSGLGAEFNPEAE